MSSHLFRFYATWEKPGVWTIQGEEKDHLARTLRLGIGATVEVFDGQGRQATGTIATLSPNQAKVQCRLENENLANPQSAPIHLIFGALRHRVFDDIYPSLVELGVDGIHIFRQVGTEKDRLNEKAIERLNRIAISAAKQCRRVYLPTIQIHQDLNQACLNAKSFASTLLVAHPESPGQIDQLWTVRGPLAILLGSEIGLREAELQSAKDLGFFPITLGPNVLRATTAMVSTVALASMQRFRPS